MRILFFTGGTTGSGHIVLGLSVAAALKRSGLSHEAYAILSLETPFAILAQRFGIPVITIPAEDGAALDKEHYESSALYSAISAFKPDVLVLDLFWFGLDAFIRELPCRKIILLRQVDPRFFHARFADGEIMFRPSDYDLVLKVEPNFDLPFPSRQIEPIVIRNRDEVLSRDAALADLGLSAGGRNCFFAFNGKSGEGDEAWKSFSYLEREGWNVVRSDNRRGGLFPAVDWYAAFDLLVCGGGYSAFWEARWFGKEAFFVPFPRQFENQARRVALCSDYEMERNGADELVGILKVL